MKCSPISVSMAPGEDRAKGTTFKFVTPMASPKQLMAPSDLGAPPGIAQAADKAGRTRELLARHGIDCPTVTGAGTGTFEFESASGVYTELQCGSDIFMDADYGRNRDRDGAPTKAFEPSPFVWATRMSRPTADRAIVDAGLKALTFDSGPPLVWDEPAAIYDRASDEHGPLAVGHGPRSTSVSY
jgi:D-serine deaminase-like pyridoxal phosphate-dependent protein